MTQPLGNCPGCGGDEPFEQVHSGRHADDRCPDTGGECAEWVCSACGTGVIMGTVVAMDPAATGTGISGADDGTQDRARQSVRAA
jgi:hypothetical protein